MDTREKRAKELFDQGCNCCQAVAAAFADDTDLSEDAILRISSCFGGGFARLREVCGAVAGMYMVMGLKHGHTDPTDAEKRKRNYDMLQEMSNEFSREKGSIICRDLLERAPDPDNHRPYCTDLVTYAVRITEKKLDELQAATV